MSGSCSVIASKCRVFQLTPVFGSTFCLLSPLIRKYLLAQKELLEGFLKELQNKFVLFQKFLDFL